MKTYTEEQLQESYNRGLMDGRLNNIDYSITDGFKPIELPKPRKTAMQELIDKIQYSIDVQSGVSLTETQVNTLKSVMLIAETLLEKEKEQIKPFINALENIVEWDDDFNDAWGSCGEYSKKILEVYNQKK
jgi:peptide deformylase